VNTLVSAALELLGRRHLRRRRLLLRGHLLLGRGLHLRLLRRSLGRRRALLCVSALGLPLRVEEGELHRYEEGDYPEHDGADEGEVGRLHLVGRAHEQPGLVAEVVAHEVEGVPDGVGHEADDQEPHRDGEEALLAPFPDEEQPQRYHYRIQHQVEHVHDYGQSITSFYRRPAQEAVTLGPRVQ